MRRKYSINIVTDKKIGITAGAAAFVDPRYDLDILKDQANGITFNVENTNTGANAFAKISLKTPIGSAADVLTHLQANNVNWSYGIDTSDGGKFKISSSNALGTNDYLTITTDGKFGIGLITPDSPLHIKQNSGHAYITVERASQSQGQVGINFKGGVGGYNWQIYQTVADDSLRFYNSSMAEPSLIISKTGNVGIGGVSTGHKLHVNSGSIQVTGGNVYLDSTRGLLWATNGNYKITFGSNGELLFTTNAVERLRIATDGNAVFSGTVKASGYLSSDGSSGGTATVNGMIFKNGIYISGSPGTATVAWGNITGTLSAQTDLQNALSAKLSLTGGSLTGELSTIGNITLTGTDNLIQHTTGALQFRAAGTGFHFGYTQTQNLNVWNNTALAVQLGYDGYVNAISGYKVNGAALNYSHIAGTPPGSGSAVWGSIFGTLSNQTDLQNALNTKAASTHYHATGDITSGALPIIRGGTNNNAFTTGKFIVFNDLTMKLESTSYDGNSFAAAGHTHNYALSDHNHSGVYEPVISVLDVDKGGTGQQGSAAFLPNEFLIYHGNSERIISSGYTSSSFALSNHNHTGVYAGVSHQHEIDDVTSLTLALSGKEVTMGTKSTGYAFYTVGVGWSWKNETYSLSTHTHDLSGYALAGHTHAEFSDLANDLSLLEYVLANQYSTTAENDNKYAAAGHNHSALYEPIISKSAGYLKWNGSSWTFVNETYSLSSHTHDLSGYSLVSHNHAGTYQPILNGTGFVKISGTTISYDSNTYSLSSHNHSGVYSLSGHNHDGVYATAGHNHNLAYSAIGHDHNAAYEPLIAKATGYLRYTGTAWEFKNETYSLSSHNHDAAYAMAGHNHNSVYEGLITKSVGYLKWNGSTWGFDNGTYATTVHTHPVSDITNLQTSLDGKSNTGHGHGIADITNLATSLSGLQGEIDNKANLTHSHAISDITSLSTALAGKSDTSHNHAGVYEPLITKATGYLKYNGTAWAFVNETYSLSSHTHDLSGYSLTSHNHTGVYEPIISKSTGYLKYTGSTWSFVNETYSLSTHNHNGTYEPAISKSTGYLKYNGTTWSFVNETYSLSSHNHDGAYATSGHNHSGTYEPAISKSTGYLKYNGTTWSFVNETYALSGHTHDLSGYSLTSHNHSGTYEPIISGKAAGFVKWTGTTWSYDSNTYALSSHTHDLSAYSLTTHTHTGVYAPASHTHLYEPVIDKGTGFLKYDLATSTWTFDGSTYSLSSHNHNGVYAAASHTHDYSGTYAPYSHSHSEYASSGHTHSGYESTIPKAEGYLAWSAGTGWYSVTSSALMASLDTRYSLLNHTHTGYSLTGHNHSGVYEPFITKSSGFLKWNGSSWYFDNEVYATSGHNHSMDDVINLNAALSILTNSLNAKADSNHTHTGYATTSHGHGLGDVTALNNALSWFHSRITNVEGMMGLIQNYTGGIDFITPTGPIYYDFFNGSAFDYSIWSPTSLDPFTVLDWWGQPMTFDITMDGEKYVQTAWGNVTVMCWGGLIETVY